MANNEEIIAQAKYYVENDVTMKQVGEHFNVHKKTIQLRLNERLKDIDLELYNLVQEKKSGNLVEGAKKGGKNGKPTNVSIIPNKPHIMSPDYVTSIADYMLDNDSSLRDVEKNLGISKSTLHDNLTKEILGEERFTKIEELLENHKPRNRTK